jgi:hypothetical protein
MKWTAITRGSAALHPGLAAGRSYGPLGKRNGSALIVPRFVDK